MIRKKQNEGEREKGVTSQSPWPGTNKAENAVK